MTSPDARAALARFRAADLDLDEQRRLVRGYPGAGDLYVELPQRDSLRGQAEAIVEVFRARGLIDDALLDELVAHLPDQHDAVCALALALGLRRPAPPPVRARRAGVGVRVPVFALTAPIGDQPVAITDPEIRAALDPDVPDGEVFRVDLGAAGVLDGGDPTPAVAIIRDRARLFLDGRMRADHPAPAPVFAFGPIPLLAALGRELGNKRAVQIMQRYNWLSPAWGWRRDAPPGGEFEAPEQVSPGGGADAGLLLSLSGRVDREAAARALPDGAPLWEIRVRRPARDQLRTEGQLTEFRGLYDQVVAAIQAAHGRAVRVHVFPAVPVAAAVALGQTLIPKVMPELFVYDYRRLADGGAFVAPVALSGPG